MAAAVMTRPTPSSTSSSSSSKTRAATNNTMSSQYKTLIQIPPRLHLGDGAASSSSSSPRSSISSISSLSQSGGSDSGDRKRSSTNSGPSTIDTKTVQRRERDGGAGAAAAGKGKRERHERRERSSRIVLNGELIDSQLSPKTQESICQVFSFNTRGLGFEESIGQVWPLRCSFVVKELIETERAYVEALGDIIKGYITPLYGYLLSSGDGPNFIRTVFSNIVKIHRHHLELLDSLQSLYCKPKPLARLFLDRDFGLYTEYCTNYSKANEYLEQALANSSDLQTFILECQSKLDHSLPLNSHLIKPVQRILKYPLLLEELVKNFDETHFAYSTVKEACRKMTKVAWHINSSFNKPAKKRSLTPSAIARIRSKEVEGLQRRRSATPSSPRSPTSTEFLTIQGHSKRSLSVEPGEIGTTDHTQLRNRRRWSNRKKQVRRHLSVENLYQDEHAMTSSSSEDDHLARVSDLKSFFENLNTTSGTTTETIPQIVVEVAPLERRKLRVFEKHGNQDNKEEKKTERCIAPEETSTDWPSVRKTSVKFGSSSDRSAASPPAARKASPPTPRKASPPYPRKTSPPSPSRASGKEHSKNKCRED